MNDWRLVSELEAYVVIPNKQVWLAASGKKSYKNDVVRGMDTTYRDSYQEVHIDENEFKLKLDNNLDIFIRSDQLPSEDWYKVMNYMSPDTRLSSIGNIITQVESRLGEFEDVVFEAAFSDRDKGQVKLVADGMIEYDEYFDEMTRRMNCSIYKKTKKWTAGHRYDSEQETYYYLGEFKARRKEEFSSGFVTVEADMPEAHLVVKSLDGKKSLKEVFETATFGDGPKDILVLRTLPSMVDSGEVLSLDNMPDDIKELWPTMLENHVKKSKESTLLGGYKKPKYIFDIFCYQTPGKESYDGAITDDMRDTLTKVIRTTMYSSLVTYWNLDSVRENIKVSSTLTPVENADHLIALYFSKSVEDGNALRYLYYTGFFKQIGINLMAIANDCVSSWDENSVLFGSFNDYVRYGDIYFRFHDQGQTEKTSQQRVKSCGSYKQKVITINEACAGDNILTQTLVDMVNKSMETYGVGITKFKISNVGTRRSPAEFVTAEVTIKDIINHFGGDPDNVPENLQREIMSQKFRKLVIDFDKDEIVK